MLPKISIIIPTYNVEKYIEKCLISCINQTLSEIEIICIDDNSKDKTVEILMDYQKKDERIKIICLDKPSSALVARKRGVEVANGEYILFVDADDYLDLEACSLLYEKIKTENVEILHFSAKVMEVKENNVSKDRIELNKMLIKPYKKYLKDEAVFNKFFNERSYNCILWNKLFDTKLCKKAFSHIEDEYMPKAQDLYSYFVISYFAKSYFGWKSKSLYYYNFGNGYTGKFDINLDVFERYCTQYKVINAMSNFAKKQGILEKVENGIDRYKKQFINECVNMWITFKNENLEKATNILFASWKIEILLEVLTKKFHHKKGYIAKKIYNANLFPIEPKNNKVIGIYYYNLKMGGIQRVISLIIPMLVKLGYKVVLITDEEPSSNDYIIDCQYEREIIKGNVDSTNYIKRLESIKKVINKHSIDLILYHAWISNFLLWDILYLKSQNIPVIIHTHLIYTYFLNKYKNVDDVYIPALANGIITLSETDKKFWGLFNNNTKFLPNPIDLNLKNVERVKGNNKILIWSARITASQKQLNESFKILKEVIKYDSDIKLWVCGDGTHGSVLNKCRKKAKKLKLDNNIVFWGFQKDIYEFYKKSSMNLITSSIEGYPMTLIEVKAHGIPTVMYELPYLYLSSKDKGTISVEKGDYKAAAKEIVSLLNNKDRWNYFSDLSYNTIKNMCNIDYSTELLSIINNINNKKVEPTTERLMIETTITNCIEEESKNKENIIKKIIYFKKMFGLKSLIKEVFYKIRLYLK